jgi:hypothetical protein
VNATDAGGEVISGSPPRDADELAPLEAAHPEHQFWRETLVTGTRYHCQSRNLAAHPYAVVTNSVAELAAALAAGHST